MGKRIVNRYTWKHGFPFVSNFIQSEEKKKNENVIADEIGVSDLFPKYIVLKSKEDL